MLCDRLGNPITLLGPFSRDRSFTFRLNQPSSFTFRVPADHTDVAALHVDGHPRLTKIRRTVKAYRQEHQADGTSLFVLRFAGIVWDLADDGAATDAWTTAVAYDPLKRLETRLCGTPETGYVFERTDTDAATIVRDLVDVANEVGATGLTTDGGSFEPAIARTVRFEQRPIWDCIRDLLDANPSFDLYVEPLDRTDGVLGRLHCLQRRGTTRSDVFFGWDSPPGNVQQITRAESASAAATRVVGVASTGSAGDRLIATASNGPLEQEIGVWEVSPSYNAVTSLGMLAGLVEEELAQRSDGRPVVTAVPDAAMRVQPWTHFDVGDLVTVRAGSRLRGGSPAALQRIYGFDLALDDDGTERLTALVTSRDT
ncbi:MAG: hypothetical protein R3C15_15415 [Thermoleophilia bacterium]